MVQRREQNFTSILDGLKSIYHSKIEPLESASGFEHFYSPALSDRDLDSKPLVLLLGQYSTGKTTFINYLLDGSYPGAHIGPEPTTDKFFAVMKGETERILPGNAATVQSDLPFAGLSHFGTSFLSKFAVSLTNAPLAELVTLIDTPGVLSGDKQRLGRSYDFAQVVEWFAQRSDMILLLFDAHKLDISDEFKAVIQALKGHDEKIKIVLNKADSINNQQLMRVYGALMWSLGKVINTPEVMRVYVGSFWNRPDDFEAMNKELIETEQHDLLEDLRNLPQQSAIRKVNELVKRARLARVHAYIIESLRKELPSFFGRASKQQKLIDNLADEFAKIQKTYNLPKGDFPEVAVFQEKLRKCDLSTFPKLSTKLLAAVDEALSVNLPALLDAFPQELSSFTANVPKNPFSSERLESFNIDDPEIWVIKAENRLKYQKMFRSICPAGATISGPKARNFFMDSKLADDELAQVWKLADADQDGKMTEQEFMVAMHLIDLRLHGLELPESLSISAQ